MDIPSESHRLEPEELFDNVENIDESVIRNISGLSLCDGYQSEEYLRSTETCGEKEPAHQHQLDQGIEPLEIETVQWLLDHVEHGHDHPEPQPGEVILEAGGGDCPHSEVGR